MLVDIDQELEEIATAIQQCLNKGLADRIGKQHIEDAMDSLVPLLGKVAYLEKITEVRYLEKCGDGIDICTLRGERLITKWAECYAAQEKGELTEAKRLSKSLDGAISALQSRLKEVSTL